MGGSETGPGLFINWSLRLGTTSSRCITFKKFWPISRDLVFDVRILELWVVNEVLRKKSSTPKRDFYSTVVMWNKMGKNMGSVRQQEFKTVAGEEFLYTNDTKERETRGDTQSSQTEIHETEPRHFVQSNPAVTTINNNNNNEDESMAAIHNRLARVPVTRVASGLRHESSDPLKGQDITIKHPYNQLSKSKKASSDADDTVITEIKHQGTSTSRIKLISTYTQSGIGFPSHTWENARLQQPAGRMHHVDDWDQSPRPSQKETNHLNHLLSPRKKTIPFAQYANPPLPNMATRENPPIPHYKNSHTSHDNYQWPSQRNFISHSQNSKSRECSHSPSPRDQTWIRKKSMEARLPQQQQLIRSSPPTAFHNGNQNMQERIPYQQNQMEPAPLTPITIQEINGDRDLNPNQRLSEDHATINEQNARFDRTKEMAYSSNEQHAVLQLVPEQVPVLTMQPLQMCRCGSKELNLVCSCKKPEIDCNRPCLCGDGKKKKKVTSDQSKAEKKRRKKEEREQKKREKKEQKEREKERKKKNKEHKKRKSGQEMCCCCQCGADEIKLCVDTSCDEKHHKKSKKEKHVKEKKPKKEKKKKESKHKGGIRSCECPDQRRESIGVEELGCCNHPEFPCPALEERNCKTSSHIPPVCRESDSHIKSCHCSRNNIRVANMSQMEQQCPESNPAPIACRNFSPTRAHSPQNGSPDRRHANIVVAPAVIPQNGRGQGDTNIGITSSDRSPSSPQLKHFATGFTPSKTVIDLSKKCRENTAKNHYVPPCVLYLDCTKVKDLCVIIRDKYEEPS